MEIKMIAIVDDQIKGHKPGAKLLVALAPRVHLPLVDDFARASVELLR